MNTLKCVELFGGIGAFRKALIKQNIPYEIVDYIEIDKNAVKSYNALYNENYMPKNVKDYHLPKDFQIDILMHGSPCQDFSLIGLKKGGKEGSETRSSLLWETIRIIKETPYKPKYVIWENVKGVLQEKMKPTFLKYLLALQELGYKNSYAVLNALDFGIPQHRERIFVVSSLDYYFDFNALEKENGYGLLPFYLDQDYSECHIVKQKSILEKICRYL